MSDEQLTRSTELLETRGSPDPESVTRGRGALEAVKDAAPENRDEHVKTALGETIDLKTAGVMQAPDVEENLTAILTRPDEEAPFFINQALRELERLEDEVETYTDTDEDAPLDATTEESEPPECVRWVGEDRGVIEIEATRPFIEWLALEAEEGGHEVEWYILLTLHDRLTTDLAEMHSHDPDVEIELSEDFAQRAALHHADAEARGWDSELVNFVLNHLRFEPTFTLAGEPWALTEGEGDA